MSRIFKSALEIILIEIKNTSRKFFISHHAYEEVIYILHSLPDVPLKFNLILRPRNENSNLHCLVYIQKDGLIKI